MKTAWEALPHPWKEWYEHNLSLESFFPAPEDFHAEVRQILHVLAEHDPPTALHSLRVARHARWLGEELKLTSDEQRQLDTAARLHDIGKISVPRSILTKKGPLSAEEFQKIQRQVLFGERMVRTLTPCPAVQQAVRWHQERLDGQGYPDGIRGEHIPLFARLLAVADAFDNLTHPSPPASPMNWREAMERLQRNVGRQFHEEAVEAFDRACRKHLAGRRGVGSSETW